MKFKEIRLFPSHFMLDVFVRTADEKIKQARIMHLRYGADESYYAEDFDGNSVGCVSIIRPTEESLCGKRQRVVLELLNLDDLSTVVHECQHVVHKLREICNVETDNNSTEWNALFMDYLFEQITERTVYHQLYSTYEEL